LIEFLNTEIKWSNPVPFNKTTNTAVIMTYMVQFYMPFWHNGLFHE